MAVPWPGTEVPSGFSSSVHYEGQIAAYGSLIAGKWKQSGQLAVSWWWGWASKPGLLVRDVVEFGREKHPRGQRCLFPVPRSCWGGSPATEGADRHCQETAVGAQDTRPLTWRALTWEIPLSLGKPQVGSSLEEGALVNSCGSLLPRGSPCHTVIMVTPRLLLSYSQIFKSYFLTCVVFIRSLLFNCHFIFFRFLKLIQTLTFFF